MIIVLVDVAVIVVIGFLLGNYYGNMDYFSKAKHQTESWAVIQDLKGDIIAFETTNPIVRNCLANLENNQNEMWTGGVVENYDNYWGFRFRPDTVIVAEVTIEGGVIYHSRNL